MGSRSNSRRCAAAATAFLLFFVFGVPAGGETVPAGIQVEMDSKKPLSLRVELRSGAETRVTFYKSRLPWGSIHSMILVAVTPSGRYLEKELPIDDPSPEKVTLDPKQSLRGDINLQKVFKGLDEALEKSDIQVFWAYEAPEELRIARWSGGWILIAQHQ
jgi:hypothetical protein